MPDSVNLDKSAEVWEAATGYVLRNPALALPKLEMPDGQNLCGSTAFINQGTYDFHSYLIAKCTINGGVVSKAMDFVQIPGSLKIGAAAPRVYLTEGSRLIVTASLIRTNPRKVANFCCGASAWLV
jgi:hypothetical protein